MRPWKWLAILAPLLLGAGLALFFSFVSSSRTIPVVYLRADLGTLSLLAGLFITLISALIIALLNRTERALAQAGRAAAEERRHFLSRLDHELKNPLTAIRAGIANLAESVSANTLAANGANQKSLDSLQTQTLRISRLTADLRKLAEIEVRQVERLPVDIQALLNETFQMACDLPWAEGRTLNLSLPQAPWPLPTIQGDADLLLLAVHNLLENALKFSSPGDTVELRAYEDGQQLVIEVADTGPGIPEEEQPHVWEELYRGQSSRGIPGSGLGLALVQAILERHNGSSSLRSRLDQGTVFTLRLPTG